ncbi:hypothetical protein LGM89_03070 [Burkholderia sp. AU31624]|uniref:hypothetical protein n=1 Tax=Burkholderia sp. AU31624 TaxID=2879629 RepID=UPI001CF5C1B1|nr:hypothetical protein [Burkholderia sp. AU31624]MCA8252239.1 hypothetical protein [Burkholderia sp. AU31624]
MRHLLPNASERAIAAPSRHARDDHVRHQRSGNCAHAAGVDCYWAVPRNGKHAAVANTHGIVGTDDAMMHSVSSFRFER